MAQPPYPGRYYAGAPMPPYSPAPYTAAAAGPSPPYVPPPQFPGYVPYPGYQYHQPAPPMMPFIPPNTQQYAPPPPPPASNTPTSASTSASQDYMLSGAARPPSLLSRSTASTVSAAHVLKPMNVFISRIPLNSDDVCLRQLLDQCGRVVKWIRMSHPVTGELKSFGFCQFIGPAGLVGAKRLLSDLKLNDDDAVGLLVKVDPRDEPICEEYVSEAIDNSNEEWHVKEQIVRKIVEDRKIRLAEASATAEGDASKRDNSPRHERSDQADRSNAGDRASSKPQDRKRTRSESPTAAGEAEETEEKKKVISWKKSTTTKTTKAAPVIDAFANQVDESHIATLYARKERDIKPLIQDSDMIWAQVPTEFNALTDYQFDWEKVDRNALLNGTIKTFLGQKVCEYLGQPEPDLVNFILSKIIADMPFKEIVSAVEVIFEKDSQPFILKLWSQIVFEYLSLL